VRPIVILHLALIYLGPALFFAATGLLLSLKFRKAVTAGALNLGIAASLWGLLWFTPLVIPLVLRVLLLVPAWFGLLNPDLVVDAFLDDHFSQVIDAIFVANPIALLDAAVSPGVFEIGPRGIARVPFQTKLIYHNLDLAECTWVVLSVFTFYTLAAAAMIATARFWFRDWSGRAS